MQEKRHMAGFQACAKALIAFISVGVAISSAHGDDKSLLWRDGFHAKWPSDRYQFREHSTEAQLMFVRRHRAMRSTGRRRSLTERSGNGTTRVLVLSPSAATDAKMTHSALLISKRSYSGRVVFSGQIRTVKQLRIGSAPNPWECAWLVWNYLDQDHFYYLAVKPTGWELGKRDPAYPGGQRFLASGSKGFSIGEWTRFSIGQARNSIAVRLNGRKIAAYVDAERPYMQGRLGLYAEDAEAQITNITAPFADNFAHERPLSNTRDGSAIKNWLTPFLGFGYVAIADKQ
jgi:hypothetical protein